LERRQKVGLLTRPDLTASAAQQAVEARLRLVASITTAFSPVVKYHGLARRYPSRRGFLMRPLLNGGTLIWNDGSSSKGGFSSFARSFVALLLKLK
jgi:hypothetical protein